MQISSVNIGPVTPGSSKIEGGGSTSFQNVGIGEAVSVEVVEAKGSSITLKTSDGTMVKADFPGAPVMQPGDKLELVMTSKSTGFVHMRLSAVNGQPVNVGAGVLETRMMDMGVEPSMMNKNAAQFLVERNVQPTPDRITNLVKTAVQFPELPASMALFMAANNIPATEPNVNALIQWMGNGEMLGEQAAQLEEAVTQMLAEQGMQAAPQEGATVTPQASVPVQSQALPVFQQTFIDTAMQKMPALPEGVVTQEDISALAGKMENMDESQARAAITEFVSQLPLPVHQKVQVSQALIASFQDAQASVPTEQAQESAATGEPLVARQAGTQPQQAQDATAPPTQAQTQNAVQEQGMPQEAIAAKQEPPLQNQGVQQQTPQAHQRGEAQATQNTQDSPAVKEMQQVLQSLGKFFTPMKRDVASDAESLQAALKNQQSNAESIHTSLSRIAGESSGAAQKAADLSTRIQMGNNLENFYYCQVPFEISQQKQTAELYVFERRRGTDATDRVNTTILIALETQNMDRVETVLKAEEDNLNIEFRVQNNAVLDYLQEVSGELEEGLNDGGFSVKGINVVRMDTPATPLNVDQILGEKENFQLQAIDISV